MITIDDLLSYMEGTREYSNYYMAICPFHDDHYPSLMVHKPRDPRTHEGWFRCLSCQAEGNYTTLYNAYMGHKPHYSSKGRLIEWSGLNIPTYENLEWLDNLAWSAHRILIDNTHLGWYLDWRGVSESIEPCKLGWYNGWYTIPIYQSNGDFNGLVLRAGPPIQEATGQRFDTPRGQPPLLYVPEWPLLRNAKTLFIVYGMFDAIALASQRYAVCTTTSGKDSFKPEWLDWWKGRMRIVPDMGEEKTAFKLAGQLGVRAGVVMLDYPDDCRDPADYLIVGKKVRLAKELAKYT